jgi:hypothetical protein
MKKVLSYAITFMAGSLLSGTVAMAATNYVQATTKPSVIQLNGNNISSPPALVYGGTTYVQLYSIQNGLQQVFGTRPTWDGTHFNIITPSSTGTSQSTSSDQGIAFSNITVKSDGFGDTIVDGTAQNTTSATHSFVMTVTFYDESGKILGTAQGAVDSLAAGDSKTFEAVASSDYTKAASYKVQVDALM